MTTIGEQHKDDASFQLSTNLMMYVESLRATGISFREIGLELGISGVRVAALHTKFNMSSHYLKHHSIQLPRTVLKDLPPLWPWLEYLAKKA